MEREKIRWKREKNTKQNRYVSLTMESNPNDGQF